MNLTYYRHPHKIGQRVAGYIAEYEHYNIQLAYHPRASNCADATSWQPDFTPNPYNDEPVVALPEHLFIPPNTPTIELQTQPFRTQVLTLDCTGAESTDDPKWDVEAMVQIWSTNNENLETDIETDIIHLQQTLKHQSVLNTWHMAHNIEQCDDGLWWKDHAPIVVESNNLRRGVLMNFHDSSSTGHPGITKTIDAFTLSLPHISSPRLLHLVRRGDTMR